MPKKPICYLSTLNLKQEKYLDIYINSFYKYKLNIFFHTHIKKKILTLKGRKIIQKFNSFYDPKFNLNWNKSFSLNIKKYLKDSGLYSITIEDENKNVSSFPFVKSDLNKKKKSKILLIFNLSTWHAYNCWGGLSRYRNFYKYPLNGIPDYFSWKRKYKIKILKLISLIVEGKRKSNLNYETELLNQKISILKPMINNWMSAGNSKKKYFDHLSSHEWRGISWLKKNNIDFDLVSDNDLSKIKINEFNYKSIVVLGHSEYWTKKSIKSIENIIKSKEVSFVNLSGNSFFQEVEYFPKNKIMFKNKKIREIMPIFKNIYPLDTSMSVKDFSHFEINKNKLNHWLLRNIIKKKKKLKSFGKSSLISNTSIKEKKYYDPSIPSEIKKFKTNKFGSSGWEIDKFDNKNHNFEIIATGQNKGDGAIIAIKQINKKIIFFASSLAFISSLLVDKVASGIVLNLFKKILDKR